MGTIKSSKGKSVDSSKLFTVLIAYENLAAAQRAMQLLSRVVGDVAQDLTCQPQPWRFDLLADPDWARCAAAEARQADLLVISSNATSELPASVRNWLRGCLQSTPAFPAALVALFGNENQSTVAKSRELAFLENIAREAGVDFFGPPESLPEAAVPGSSEAGVLNRARGLLAERHYLSRGDAQFPPPVLVPPYLGSGFRGWGINE